MTGKAQAISEKFGYTLGKMGHGDARRLVQEPGIGGYISKPWYVAKDGRVIHQFETSRERLEWLENAEELAELPARSRGGVPVYW